MALISAGTVFAAERTVRDHRATTAETERVSDSDDEESETNFIVDFPFPDPVTRTRATQPDRDNPNNEDGAIIERRLPMASSRFQLSSNPDFDISTTRPMNLEEGSETNFDEADGLFGRRTTVRDSHDQYANETEEEELDRLRREARAFELRMHAPELEEAEEEAPRGVRDHRGRNGEAEISRQNETVPAR